MKRSDSSVALATPTPVTAHGPIVSGQARFTVLSSAMIRMEWSPTGHFENRPSFVFTNRDALSSTSEFEVSTDGQWLVIETKDLVLRYRKGSGKFSSRNLSVHLKAPSTPVTWHPGMPDRGNLLGTARTLDQASGPIPLQPGLISRDGWVVVDDSRTILFNHSDWPWAVSRESSPALDWYFLGYSHDYKRALREFTRVSGRIPLPPRWAFGAWWSRYWAYSEQEFMDLVKQFDDHDVPLDVLVVDMDWHLPGWTGYTWNPKYFPDPVKFLRWCHQEGLHVPLNVHPADGVGKQEAAFPQMARAMGLDPKKVDRVPFDCTSRRYVDAYFKYLHHPLERQGVDFWWIDWQQGTHTKIPGLDPLSWLNYLHWTDMERNPARSGRRPILLSRWGGLSGHRYQIGFSGDTHCTWSSLAFEPYFTATAGNVAYPYWSHDIGGHIPGPVGGELYARWIQFGAFSPILRTHAGANPKSERRIWAFPPDIYNTAKKAFWLRYTLNPYIYTTARECYDSGLPMLRPLYYDWPEFEKAYTSKSEYLFGDEMLAAPVTEPRDPESDCASTRVWLPPGRWHHWFTGRTYEGPAEYTLMTPLDEIPLFVRDGAVIPAMPRRKRIDEKPLDSLVLHVFPGKEGNYTLYEDDGVTTGYEGNRFARTAIRMTRRDGACEVVIGPTVGSYRGIPAARPYEIRFRDIWPPRSASVDGVVISRDHSGNGKDAPTWEYDAKDLTAVVRIPPRSIRDEVHCRIELAGEDESPLRRGLRGDLLLLRELKQRFGSRAPRGMTAILDAWKTLSSSPQTALPVLRKVEGTQWNELTRSLSSAPVKPRLAREAFLRMTGFAAKMHAKTRNGGGGIEVTLTADMTRPGQTLAAKIDFSVPSGWRIVRKTIPARSELEHGSPMVYRAVIEPRNSVQTVGVEANVEVRSPDSSFEVPLKQVLLPSIDSWWIIGPFGCPWEKDMATAFPPEKNFNVKGRYKGKDGIRVRWRKVTRKITADMDLEREFHIDLLKVFNLQECNYAVAYAATYIHSPREMDAMLAMGADDGIGVWLNGKPVYQHQVKRPYSSKEDHAPIHLKRGANLLLLKITQDCNSWGFCAHLETPDGAPLVEAHTSLEP